MDNYHGIKYKDEIEPTCQNEPNSRIQIISITKA